MIPIRSDHKDLSLSLILTDRESAFTYKPGESNVKSKQQSAELVTHEIAHQWFGNLVTFTWWTDLWLSEGFATYMSNVAVDKVSDKLFCLIV